MDALNAVNKSDGSGQGRADTRDYFGNMVGRLSKDIEDLVKTCQQVMTLDIKKAAKEDQLND